MSGRSRSRGSTRAASADDPVLSALVVEAEAAPMSMVSSGKPSRAGGVRGSERSPPACCPGSATCRSCSCSSPADRSWATAGVLLTRVNRHQGQSRQELRHRRCRDERPAAPVAVRRVSSRRAGRGARARDGPGGRRRSGLRERGFPWPATATSSARRSAISSPCATSAPTASRWPPRTTCARDPPRCLRKDGRARIVRRRESFEDLIATEPRLEGLPPLHSAVTPLSSGADTVSAS